MGDRMIELTVGAEAALGNPVGFRINPPDLHSQALGRTPTGDIDRMNRYPACHLASYPLSAGI